MVGGGISIAATSELARRAAQAAVPARLEGMEISASFDGGLLPPATIDGNTVTFDLKGEVGILNVLVRRAPRGCGSGSCSARRPPRSSPARASSRASTA